MTESLALSHHIWLCSYPQWTPEKPPAVTLLALQPDWEIKGNSCTHGTTAGELVPMTSTHRSWDQLSRTLEAPVVRNYECPCRLEQCCFKTKDPGTDHDMDEPAGHRRNIKGPSQRSGRSVAPRPYRSWDHHRERRHRDGHQGRGIGELEFNGNCPEHQS